MTPHRARIPHAPARSRTPGGLQRALGTLLALLLLTGGSVLAQEGAVVLEVGEEAVTKAEFEARFEVAARAAALQQGLEPTEENLAGFDEHREAFLEQYATQLALLAEAESRGIEVDETAVDEALSGFRAQFEDEEAFRERVVAMGFDDVSALREDVRTSLTVRALIDAIAADAAPSDDEIRAWYEAHPDRFTSEDGATTPFEDARADIARHLVQQIVEQRVQEIRADADVTLHSEHF